MNESPVTPKTPDIPIEMRGVFVGARQDPDFILVNDVNWSVAAGEFWVVGAPHHSGKTDFLMTAAGLIPPVGGLYKYYGNETRIFDESRLADRLRMGFIFEQAEMFHHLTVAENIALPLRYHQNLKEDETMAAIDELLHATDLKPIADAMPSNLPQPWHKRAGLARALALRPDILLADNPLGSLDLRHCHWWRRLLDELSLGHKWLHEKPLTIVVTTDDFRHWRGSRLKFALLKENSFVPLGSWNELLSSEEPLVKELLTAPLVAVQEGE